MIYFIVTTSIYNDCSIRKQQYTDGINKLKQIIQALFIENYKIIVVENNGPRHTFLNTLGCEVYYTKNNLLHTKNKGQKELQDILDCISHFHIDDNDFIVKMTGRYILNVKRTDSKDGWYFNLKILIITKDYNELLINVGNSKKNDKNIDLKINID